MVPQKQKYYIVEQLIGQLLVYLTALLVQICITLCLLLLVIVRGWLGLKSFGFYFCFSVMIKMGYIMAEFDSHRQTDVSWVCLPGQSSLCKVVLGMDFLHPFGFDVAEFLLVKTCEPS